MAEDVEIILEGDPHEVEGSGRIQAAISPPLQPTSSSCDLSSVNGISSTDSSADCIIDVVSTVETHSPDLVGSMSNRRVQEPPLNLATTSSTLDSTEKKTRTHSGQETKKTDLQTLKGKKTQIMLPSSSQDVEPCSNNDCDCEIVVDDISVNEASPKDVTNAPKIVCSASKIQSVLPMSTEPSLIVGHPCSRSTTPSPSINPLTPSTPGTPRQRSGSVSGPSPRPSARNTPSGERQRSGSVGELDMRERSNNGKVDVKQGIRVLDHLDILQLPRPRNPGGVLQQNGHEIDSNGNGAVNLVINNRQATKRKSDDRLSNNYPSFTNFLSSSSSVASNTANSSLTNTTSANTSYLISNIIRTTPNKLKSSITLPASLTGMFDTPVGTLRRWSTSINEGIERPLPSSVVDNEGVAKKIARLDNQGLLGPNSVNSLWTGALSSHPEAQQFRNLRSVLNRTPPERPKPPRRDFSSPLPDVMPGDRIITPSPRLRSSPASSSSQLAQSSIRISEGVLGSDMYPSLDADSGTLTSRPYKCRVCHTTFSSHTLYVQHMNRHGSASKLMKCPLCDYITSEKTNFRRHRRLHSKSSPGGNVLRCGKCSFSTLLPKKLKDHYQFVHHTPFQGPSAEPTDGRGDGRLYTPHRYTSSRNGTDTDSFGLYSCGYLDVPGLDQSGESSDRSGYTFPGSTRHQSINYPIDHYSVSFIRPRQEDGLSSNYLRSVVNSDNRHQASSTITSSSYFLPPGCNSSLPPGCSSSHNLPNVDIYHDSCGNANCSNNNHVGVKIKIEPDLDVASDVSSTATPDISRPLSVNQGLEETVSRSDSSAALHRPVVRHRSLDSAAVSALRHQVTAQEGLGGITSSGKSRTISSVEAGGQTGFDYDLDNGSEANVRVPSCTVVKSDTISRGVQCSMAVIKLEMDQDGELANRRDLNRIPGVDRAVQCNLPTTQNSRSQNRLQRLADRTVSMSESEMSEHPSSVSWESRCEHCGIAFDDEVIYSIHIGCHSHTDPFMCNVCGKQCGNKYGFYSHIMRGHHF